MDAPNAETIKAYAELASSLSQFRTSMFFALCGTVLVLGLGSGFLFFWFRRAMQRDRNRADDREQKRAQDIETSKQARAALFTQAQLEQAKSLTSLVIAIQNTQESAAQMHETTNNTLKDLGATVSRTGQALVSVVSVVKRLADKVEGRLSREDSSKFITGKLNADMFRAICGVVERSFNENHYMGRETFIADRVRSRIRDVMVAVRSELKELPLAVPIEPFFPTVTDDNGERFTLCDQVWSKVVHLFSDKRQADERMDEASLLIENIIKDQIARVSRRDQVSAAAKAAESVESTSDFMRAVTDQKAVVG